MLLELIAFACMICFCFAKEAIILGSSGLVGGLVLQNMLADPTWSKVHIIVRRPATIRHPKINEILVTKMSEMEINPQLLELANASNGGIDAAVVTLGVNEPFGWKLQKLVDIEVGLTSKFAKFCRLQLGVKYVGVLTMAGTTRDSPLLAEELETEITYTNIFTLAPRVKGEVEEAVLAQGFPHSSFFRPANFETDEYRFGFMDVFLQFLCSILNYVLPSEYHSIHVLHIAKAMAADAAAFVADDTQEAKETINQYDEMMALASRKVHVEL